jgi:hypothetical protein
MPRHLTTSSGRTRGSWTPRLAGIGAVVLVASGGVVAYLITSPAHAARHIEQLPTRVASVQTVGIVAQQHGRPRLLRPAGGGLRWAALPPGDNEDQGNPQWTADTMAGGTMVFIYVPSGQCLASVRHKHGGPLVALRRCDLGAAQRWQQLGGAQASQRPSGQYRNLASGRCLTVGGTGQPGRPAVQAQCARASPSQLISFWWGA